MTVRHSGPQAAGTDAEDDVVDVRMVELLYDFARLSGAEVEPLAPNLVRLRLAHGDAHFFGGEGEHLLALSVSAVERYPDSQLPVVGGAFWSGLLQAIRLRGSRSVAGTLPVTVAPSAELPDVPVRNASVLLEEQGRAVRGVARVLVKVTLSAGTTVEEELIETDDIDLVTNLAVPEDVRSALSRAAVTDMADAAPGESAISPDRLAATLVRGIEGGIADRVSRLRDQADRTLETELGRIDRYYGSVAADVRKESGAGSPALDAVVREHERRREEEIRRHRVRVDVQPVQAIERGVHVQEASWRLTSEGGVEAGLRAQRYLIGDGHWNIRCPQCGGSPEALTVCRGAHPVGTECTASCSVCAHAFCPRHGHAACLVDGEPVCETHAEKCFSCERVHCVTHRGSCSEGHHACTECLTACAVCGREVCLEHRVETGKDAPRGTRVLCDTCVVYCEGATSEPVGVDEARPCATCDRHICERHQVRCVVDGDPHCSSHLRKADRSRRFFCEAHAGTCAFEPKLLFAADEVGPCVECGRISCDHHGVACHGDGRWHCREHVVALTDVPGAFACAAHHTICHVDGRPYSPRGTRPCEICDRPTCSSHTAPCPWCAARVCARDLPAERCVTCGNLAPNDDPPDELVAAVAALPGERRVRGWQTARDGGRYVVQLDLGWTRKLVLSVPHGSASATRVVRHSVFGAVVERGGRSHP